MQWDDLPNGGFSPQGVDTWLPLGADYIQVNVKNQLSQPHSLLNLYRSLLNLRRTYPALQFGAYQPLAATGDDCLAYLRILPGEAEILVAINFSPGDLWLDYPGNRAGEIILSTEMDRQGAVGGDQLHLRSYEGVIVRLPIV